MLHPELARLQERYNEVLDAHEAGNLSYDDALMSVQAMSVLDGGGFVWMIDPVSGAFLRATPGEQPIEADPSQFLPAQIPAAGSAPWASQQDLMRPPAGVGSGRIPQNDQYQDPYQDPYQDHHAAGHAPYQGGYPPGGYSEPGRRARGDHQFEDEAPRRRSRQGAGLAGLRNTLRELPLPPFVQRNKRMILIIAVVAVVFLVVTRTGGEDPASVAPVPQNTLPPVSQPQTPSSLPPVESTQPPAPQIEVVPTPEQMGERLSAISSGVREQVAGSFVNPGDSVAIALYTARYHGYRQTGLSISVQQPVLDEEKVFSEASLVDNASGQPLFTVRIRWIRGEDGMWRINNYIEFEK